VVLHDLAIDDLVRWFRDTGDPLGVRAAAEAEPARLRLYEARPDIQGPLETASCAHLLRRARGVIVHSTFGAEYVAALGSLTPTFVVRHPVIAPPRAARRAAKQAREIREQLGDRFVIGVLGDIGAAKGIDAVIDAVAQMRGEPRVAVVGRRIPGYDIDRVVAESRLADRITVAADVSERDFYAWLRAVDVVVNLRHPHRGEVSGTLARAMGAGKPVVVQEVGSYLDEPQDAVVRIPGGEPDAFALAEALTRLQGDPDSRERIGGRAREESARRSTEKLTARGYEQAADSTLALLRDPVRWATERWASALAVMGPGPEGAGLALPHLERLKDLADVPTGVDWAGSAGRYG
jgi:glycosyltransferase involved in cell wall biosynthesis